MEISLLLLPNEDAMPSKRRDDDGDAWFYLFILVPIVVLYILPMFWKFMFLLLLVVIIGIYLSNTRYADVAKPEPGYIFLSTENILTQVANEITSDTKLSDVAGIHVWSDYYPGYFSNGDTIHNGTMRITLYLRNGETLTHPSMIRHELQYNGVRRMLEEWYKQGVPLEETITISKQKGILLKPFSNYSYKQIQDMKMELDLDKPLS